MPRAFRFFVDSHQNDNKQQKQAAGAFLFAYHADIKDYMQSAILFELLTTLITVTVTVTVTVLILEIINYYSSRHPPPPPSVVKIQHS